MVIRRFSLLLALGLLSSTALAGSLDLNLNSHAVRFDYTAQLTPTGLEGDIGFLHNNDNGDIGHIGVDLVGNASPGGSPVIAAVGGKLFFLDPKNSNASGTALGLGGYVRYSWPTYNRFAIRGDLYYAPDIVAFGDVNRYLEYSVRGEYEILRQASVYLGYRHINAHFSGGSDVTMDNGIIAGFQIKF